LWGVLGLAGDPLPAAIHRLALDDLADNRNKLAHGEADRWGLAVLGLRLTWRGSRAS
jgi:hypothetical protein